MIIIPSRSPLGESPLPCRICSLFPNLKLTLPSRCLPSPSAPLPSDSTTAYILTSPVPSPIPTKAPPPPPVAEDHADDDDELQIGGDAAAAEVHEGDVVGRKRSADEADLEEGGEKKKGRKEEGVEYKDLGEEGGVPAIELD